MEFINEGLKQIWKEKGTEARMIENMNGRVEQMEKVQKKKDVVV